MKQFFKVIIWGHKLHSHTHSYVHEAFYKAFKYMGYDVLWLDNEDDISGLSFDNCLFLTEGQVDKNIPLVKSSKYILHNVQEKYKDYDKVIIQVYTNDVLNYMNLEKINNWTYIDSGGKTLYQPWATDLLPDEIYLEWANIKRSNNINWVGSYGEGEFGNKSEIDPFINACEKLGNTFHIYRIKNRDDHIKLIQDSYVAPTIVGKWQKDIGYIPCRIFKNISYGHIGVTNSETINNLIFDGNIICNKDTNQLFYDFVSNKKNKYVIENMKNIKANHTYINRINNIIKLL